MKGAGTEALALAELMGPGPDRSPEVKKSRRRTQQIQYTKGQDSNESDGCEYVHKSVN